MSGVPRIIHTITLTSPFKGKNFDIEPIEIIRPSGIAKSKVSPKISQFWAKPKRSSWVTFKNCSIINYFAIICSLRLYLSAISASLPFCARVAIAAFTFSSVWGLFFLNAMPYSSGEKLFDSIILRSA